MNKTIYKCNKDNVEVVDNFDLSIADENKSDVFVVNILTDKREDVLEYLHGLGVSDSICEKILIPADGIRFKNIKGVLYGEVAYFSSKDYTSHYSSVIIIGNILIFLHKGDGSLALEFMNILPDLAEKIEGDLIPEYILYWMILELISEYGNLIMKTREEIEVIAFSQDIKINKHSLSEISETKQELALLEMVLDKLYFTLSFPPSINILNHESPFSNTFNYLLKNIGMLKSYIDQTQDRLDSLNDHYQLVMHGKANKRLNFLTITQAIFVPLTLIVGVYGMNFSYMPELTYKYAYFIVLGGMLFVALMFLVYFKKNGWFD